MKIVQKDNCGSDYYVEKTICENIINDFFAEQIVKFLNSRFMDNNDFYSIESDDYILRNEPFEP